MSGRLFLTGDTHNDIDYGKMSSKRFPVQKELTKDDIVVILGDWGAIWYGNKKDNYLLKWWNNKPWTTFVILGNHENYDAIEKLPTVTKFGNEVYQAADSIFIAKSGNIYNLCGFNCLCVNGADSHDKEFRTEGKSWWSQEAITEQDYKNAIANIEKADYKVDYILSHTAGMCIMSALQFPATKSDQYLTRILIATEFKCHYCGHMHVDKWINEKERIMYDDIIEIGNSFEKTYF